jgi:hypothetical protein
MGETEPDVEAARTHFEMLQSRLNAAKIAYLNGVELNGEPVSYDRLRGIAQDMIRANYALQRARYGKVRLRLSVAKLIRRGR